MRKRRKKIGLLQAVLLHSCKAATSGTMTHQPLASKSESLMKCEMTKIYVSRLSDEGFFSEVEVTREDASGSQVADREWGQEAHLAPERDQDRGPDRRGVEEHICTTAANGSKGRRCSHSWL